MGRRALLLPGRYSRFPRDEVEQAKMNVSATSSSCDSLHFSRLACDAHHSTLTPRQISSLPDWWQHWRDSTEIQFSALHEKTPPHQRLGISRDFNEPRDSASTFLIVFV